MTLPFDLHAAAVLAPGIGSLADLLALRRSGLPPAVTELVLPSPAALPPNERRRASQVVRLTLACTAQALQASPFAVDTLRLVFASDEGTGEICQLMLEALTSTRMVSPLLFHNSVHNAPSGYLSIAWQNHQPATSLSLGRDSFAMGLLCAVTEARSSGQPVFFLCYDPPMTEPLLALLPIRAATASAWIVSCGATRTDAAALASFELSLSPSGEATSQASDPALPPWLPAAWAPNSSAQGLVALSLLDDPQHTEHVFAMGHQALRLRRTSPAAPC